MCMDPTQYTTKKQTKEHPQMTVIKTEPTTEVTLYSPPSKESLSKDDAHRKNKTINNLRV